MDQGRRSQAPLAAVPGVMPAGGGRSAMASAYGVLIGMVGGSIGLGGAEFRLPVPAGLPGYRARQAVAQNVAVTLATVTAALGTRGGALPLDSLANPIRPCRRCSADRSSARRSDLP